MGLFGGGNTTVDSTSTTNVDVDVNPNIIANIDTDAIGSALGTTFNKAIEEGGKKLSNALLNSTSNLAFAAITVVALGGLVAVGRR